MAIDSVMSGGAGARETAATLRVVVRFWRGMGAVARRPLLAASCVGLTALIAGFLPTLMGRMPVPFVHDEFAHLLAADTFLHGRLTNPTPVMWEHLETFHEIMRPTYMSMYPPAQGLSLAAGMLLHLPILGSFGMIAMGCVATYWMLIAWLPPRWALLGGMLAATHPEIYVWGQGYWAGGVGMLGGAMLGGVAARLISRTGEVRGSHGLVAGVAVELMMNHRPFEGLVTIALMASVVWAIARRQPGLIPAVRRVALPAAAVLVPVTLWMGYYNWRVTGIVTELPYTAHERQYEVAPHFYWQRPRPIPQYLHEDLRELYVDFFYTSWQKLSTPAGFAGELSRQVRMLLSESFNSWALAIPAVLGLLPIGAIGGRRTHLKLVVFVTVGSVVIHLASSPNMDFHYMQSAAPMFIAWIALALRQLSVWRVRGWMVGRIIVVAVAAAQFAALADTIWARVMRPTAPGETRYRMVEQLNSLPGKQLVLVRYKPGSQLKTLFEWVFNDSDPDHSKIVWARSMEPQKDRELLRYYHDRQLWLLDVDGAAISFGPR